MKRFLYGIFCITLLQCLLSASGHAQTGATPSSPINAGSFGPGGGSFSDSRNSSSSGNTTYINSMGQPSPEVYYRFQVSAPVTIDFSLCQSNFDTYIHILNASASEITYQDDSEDCGTRSHLAYSFTSSGTYYLAVEGYGSNTGTIALSMNVMATGGSSPNISYPSTSVTAAVGTAVSLVPTNNGGAVPAEVQALTMSGSNTLNNPLGTATDSQGNVYVADAGNQRILKITATGGVSTLAGSGSEGSADGTGTAASFRHPSALTVDATGNVYVSDQQNHRIRKITPGGVVSTLAGSGSAGYANGNGSAASFSSPIGLALDGLGNLYVADYSNHRIRKIELSTGNVSTYAGNGAAGLADGAASSASFRNPMGLCADGQGNLYVADRLNHAVRKIAADGMVSTLAGSGSAGYADGNGNAASFNQVNGVALAGDGSLYVADQQNNMVRKVSLQGVVSTFAGNTSAGTVNGLGSAIRFSSPYGLSARGNSLYVAQTGSYAVRWLQWGSYTIAPALPAGLALNSITGEITGTPASLSPATSYTVTAANGSGSSSFTFTLAVTGTSNSSTSNYNAVYTYIPRTALDDEASLPGSSIANVNRQVQYFDGLGRPTQSINVGGSPTGKDVVQPIAYDEFGREAIKYLPYTSSAGTPGAYRSDALKGSSGYDNSAQKNFYAPSGGDHVSTDFPVSISIYESSPLSRVIEQGAPGQVWQPGQGHTVKIEYTGHFYQGQQDGDIRRYEAIINTTAGQQHLRSLAENGTLSYNTLFLTITKDENWSESDGKAGCSYEYKDKEGHVVLKRSFNKMLGGTLQTLSTYYVYDDLGNLCFVLPPGANPDGGIPDATALDNFCYQYRYDSRNRLIEKKLPGKGWEEVIYNPLDQVVFTQDAVQRGGAIRSFIKYDAMGRTVMTGIEIGHHGTRAEVQGTVNTLVPYWETRDNTSANYHGYNNLSCPSFVPNLQPHVVNYYDNYNIPGIPDNQSSSYSNKTRGLLTASKTLVLGTADTFLWTVNYYDEEGRIARSWQQHYKGGVVSASNYDQNTFTYNFAGEIVSSIRKHYVAGAQKLYVYNEYGYDHTGRKISTKQRTGDNDATANPLIYLSKNSYNEIGQQLAESLHSTDDGASFAQTVKYRYNPRGWLSSQAAPLFTQELRYELDSTGLVPQYNGNISQQKWGTNTLVNKQYSYTYDRMNRLLSAQSHDGNDESIAYSEMGNITSLQRKSFAATVDQLTYSYTGNRLNSIADANANTSGLFQLPGTTNYGYDANGNMIFRVSTTSAANNLYDMGYNYLNLPTNINANGAVITYTYDAKGNKLKKLVTGNASVNNEYISGIQYEDGDLKYVNTETGRVRRISATSYSYEHTLTDHLGNGRVYFDISGGVARKIQETDYYAFGLDIQRNVVGVENKFQYNGKEKQDQEKLYDYGARFYDPVIARWNVMDPLAEKDRKTNPYAYVFNNPLRFIDHDGMEGKSTHTDFFGNVIAVYNDGDLGVYRHLDAESKNDVDDLRSETGTRSGGGEYMGDTWTALGFANFDVFEATGEIVVERGAQIMFNSEFATNEVSNILANDPSAYEYSQKAGGGGDWDIKAHSPGGAGFGSKLFGKYASARDAGNFAAGAVAKSSFWPGIMIDYGFGLYSKSGNNGSESINNFGKDIMTTPTGIAVNIGVTANFGEYKLSREGIAAGKAYMERLIMKRGTSLLDFLKLF